jgi:hypothetical protein
LGTIMSDVVDILFIQIDINTACGAVIL